MSDYPDFCLRGINKKDHITQEERVGTAAFIPDNRTKNKRSDGCSETSINWEDDKQACINTINFFQHGFVRLARSEIDSINMLPASSHEVGYERNPILDNPYHGNILFKNDVPDTIIRMIAARFALSSSKIKTACEN